MTEQKKETSFDKLKTVMGHDPTRKARLSKDMFAEILKEEQETALKEAKEKARELLKEASKMAKEFKKNEQDFEKQRKKFNDDLGKVLNQIQQMVDNASGQTTESIEEEPDVPSTGTETKE